MSQAVRPQSGRVGSRLLGYLFLAPYLVLFSTFIILPLVFGAVLSLMNWEMLSPKAPEFVGIANYREALGDEYFHRALKATVLFVVLTVPTTVCLALGLSLLLNRLRKREWLYRAALVVPMMINVTVVGILWRWFLNPDFGLFNSYLRPLFGISPPWVGEPGWAMVSIVLITLWWGVGGPAVILLAGLQQIPNQYYEAAAVDGAVGPRRFFSITLPLLRPALLFVIVTQTIASFQVFGQTYMVTRGGPALSTRVLVQYIYETAFTNYRMGYGAAMSWLLFAVIAVVSIINFRLARQK